MKVIFINGRVGSGKTTIGRAIANSFTNSIFLDGDAILNINPFSPTKNMYIETVENISKLLYSYDSRFKADIVVVSFVLYYQEQVEILKRLPFFTLYVYLDVSIADIQTRIGIQIKNKERHEDNIKHCMYQPYYDSNFVCVKNNNLSKCVQDILDFIS